MTLTEFARLAAKVRAAQKKYFRTRGQGDLTESKRLEKQFDHAIREALEQPALAFGEDS